MERKREENIMDKKKTIMIVVIATAILILLFGGIVLSNITKKPVNNKNTENVNKTEDSNTETEDVKNDNSEEVTTPDVNEPTNQPSQEEESSSEAPSTDTKPKYTFTELNKTMYASSDVNVRDLPSTDGSKVGGLSKGQAVTVTGQCNETKWYRISLNGSVVYVSNNYLTDTKPQEETPVPPSSENNTPSNPTPSEPSSPSQPNASNLDDLGNTIDRSKVDMIYGVDGGIGDGLDKYREGRHMWTADGKYQLYTLITYKGMRGYFEHVDDETFFLPAATDSYMEVFGDNQVCEDENPELYNYILQWNKISDGVTVRYAGHSTYYDPYIFMIDGKYYKYIFMANYDIDENGNTVY